MLFVTLEDRTPWRGSVTPLGMLDPGDQCSQLGNELKYSMESGEWSTFGRPRGPGGRAEHHQSQ